MFVLVKKDEVDAKLNGLIGAKAWVSIWNNDKKEEKTIPSNFYWENDSLFIIIKRLPEFFIKDSGLFISFDILGVHFFAKCLVFSNSDSSELMVLQILNGIFKVEKRKNERLLTYPHRQVILHLPTRNKSSENNNVVYLNQEESEQIRMMKQYREKFNECILEGAVCKGHRVLDISTNGIAFLVNRNEGSDIIENKEYKKALLEFGGNRLEIINLKIHYKVDIILPNFAGINMQKIGASIEKMNDHLETQIISLIGQEQGHSLKNEFEKFIK